MEKGSGTRNEEGQTQPLTPDPFASFEHPAAMRQIFLDPVATPATDVSLRAHKTEDRRVYDAASSRGPAGTAHPEVLLHDGVHVLETVTSNVAVRMPRDRARVAVGELASRESERQGEQERGRKGEERGDGEWVWVTPASPSLLPGTVRAELLERGLIVEGAVRVEDWREAKARGWNVVAFNAFRCVLRELGITADGRGVWQAEIVL